MLNFRKKIMSRSRENLKTDGRTDGQTLFYRTLPAKAGGPKKHTLAVVIEQSTSPRRARMILLNALMIPVVLFKRPPSATTPIDISVKSFLFKYMLLIWMLNTF